LCHDYLQEDNDIGADNSREDHHKVRKRGITKGHKRAMHLVKTALEKVEKLNVIAAEMGPNFHVFRNDVYNGLTSKNDSHLEK